MGAVVIAVVAALAGAFVAAVVVLWLVSDPGPDVEAERRARRVFVMNALGRAGHAGDVEDAREHAAHWRELGGP